VDASPHILLDEKGLQMAAPDEGWRQRPDMNPEWTQSFRASILARSRFVEDWVAEQRAKNVGQYVILGAGLDSFVQRRADLAPGLITYEVDMPGPSAWKKKRLIELGWGIPEWLRLVPFNFESGKSWLEPLKAAGFHTGQPAVVSCLGVSMYLTREAVMDTLRQAASLPKGSSLIMTFLLPIDRMDADLRPGFERAAQGAKAAGTPFISYFTPDAIMGMVKEAGFQKAEYVSGADLAKRYFQGRSDGLKPPDHGEELLVAST
jgi:methyltransferase (TIGR00027 family)